MPGALDADFCMDFNMSNLQPGKAKATKRLQFQWLKTTTLPARSSICLEVGELVGEQLLCRQPLGLLIAGCQDL